MIRRVRRIEYIKGVGGPFIERTMGDPKPGGCLYVGLERAPGYRDETSRVLSIAAISVSFVVGATAGYWFVAMAVVSVGL